MCYWVDILGSDVPDSHPNYSYNQSSYKIDGVQSHSTFLGAAADISEVIIWSSSFWANSELSWQDTGCEELAVWGTDDWWQQKVVSEGIEIVYTQ